MLQVSICPENKILNINCKTLEQAKQITKDYYPEACFLPITDLCHAIYERFEIDSNKMNHVGNIWVI